MSLPVLREHTDGVITALQGLGVAVGDAEAPSGVAPPYCVVYPIPGGDTYGTLGAPNDDAELVYQVTCVGVSRKQAEWLADKALGLLAGLSITGRSVPVVSLDSAPGIQRDDTKSPPLFWAAPRFRLTTTPA